MASYSRCVLPAQSLRAAATSSSLRIPENAILIYLEIRCKQDDALRCIKVSDIEFGLNYCNNTLTATFSVISSIWVKLLPTVKIWFLWARVRLPNKKHQKTDNHYKLIQKVVSRKYGPWFGLLKRCIFAFSVLLQVHSHPYFIPPFLVNYIPWWLEKFIDPWCKILKVSLVNSPLRCTGNCSTDVWRLLKHPWPLLLYFCLWGCNGHRLLRLGKV